MAQTQQAISHWSVGRGRGRGRGSRQQQSYTPSRRPGEASTPSKDQPSCKVAQVEKDLSACSLNSVSQPENKHKTTSGSSPAGTRSSGNTSAPSAGGLKTGVTKLKAKYSYKANLDSPLGEKELTVKQGQELVFVETCKDNDMWWKVQTKDGDEKGFVPSTYLEVVTEKLTQLPWLADKQLTEEEELPKGKREWKPYVSAYHREEKTSQPATVNKEQYFCKICVKQLNGPQPYSAHMNSKAHKEEVQLAKEYGTYTEDEH
ncbi:uncharacterized protein LOC121429835 isoform X1 [Lytechinus variegatus]|uniref:uncharacterized protein LOC121429835 isoform X1 n=1 Tax=Lytechinus variegatus TaxID=7654 RepID=UPI001BB27B06|nr:uncharacterized protein LOC121429835 isoform X1 [Lytechinus variegatus]